MSRELEFRITKLERDDEGFWKCNVNGIPVHCKYGSWMLEDNKGMCRQDLLPYIAAAIQEKVRPIEKKERIAREKANAK